MHERIAELSVHALDAPTVARLVTAGFDTVLLPDAEGATAIAQAAARKGPLALWLVVSPDREGRPVFVAHATPVVDPWLLDGDAALDPRRSPRTFRSGPIVDAGDLLETWREVLGVATGHGVSGFVCVDADRLPRAFWSALIPTIRARWVAWTPGLPLVSIDALVAGGFDMVCSSVAWWDGRGRWLVDEAARFSAHHSADDASTRPDTPMLAFPVDPFAVEPSRDATRRTIVQRLKAAALVGDALLVPRSVWFSIDCGPVNRWFAARRDDDTGTLRFISGPDAPLTVLLRTPRPDLRASESLTVLIANADAQREATIVGATITTALSGFGAFAEVLPVDVAAPIAIDPCESLALPPGDLRLFSAKRLPVIRLPVLGRRSSLAAVERPRLSIEAITPVVDGGRFPVKRTVGDAVRVEADLLIDGHEKLAAAVLYRAVGERDWGEVRMEALDNDRYVASFPLQRIGRHEFTIEAWRDVFASFRDELDKKFAAGLDVSLELIEGRRLIDETRAHATSHRRNDAAKRLAILSKRLDDAVGDDRGAMAEQVAALLASQTLIDMRQADRRAFATRPEVAIPVDAERGAASFAAWYELFPRSLGNPPGAPATHHGTFDDVIERLPAVRAMGFDVLYFPPIHPIGARNRKGRNNSLTAQDDDPGSPYAIGSADGGHDALHPQLGTFEDFKRLRDAALAQGLELALDFAIQCSPDHPWLKEHPGWFAWRPDGSLRYAENPPKKYEDIVNVEFYGDGKGSDAPPALWSALRDVILLWVDQGVRIFRVDNPHTKPLPFWEWMIGEVRGHHPDVIFLSEAFTRPKLMYRLAKIGFSQSYTYFTWRHTKQEFVDYLTELTTTAPRDFFRPNFFVNTPDINPVFLQRSGRAGFLIRAALASTLSGLWGVYSGFELCEATPVPGKEDYLDSEKYQLRAWDWQRPGNIVAEITALNRIRRENPAFRTHLNVRFQNVFDPNILYFSKATVDRSNVVLIAINLDPYGVHEADFELPLWEWGLADDAGVDVADLIGGQRFRWHGKTQRMRLDPGINPYAVWRVTL